VNPQGQPGSAPRPASPLCLDDASYVLGILSPAERQTFEQHLADCAACQASVARLAGLPGLLALTSAADTAGKKTQTADFYQGVFQVKQSVPKKKPKKGDKKPGAAGAGAAGAAGSTAAPRRTSRRSARSGARLARHERPPQ